ncbi:MAG: FecCD family ABC transporter permease [Actinomycetota bacterium]|nr:iron ABC transporter permease [Actinomycetota bacterium]
MTTNPTSDLRRLNPRIVATVLLVAFVIVVFNALSTGAYTIRLGELIQVLFQGPARSSGEADGSSVAHAVFWNVRLPRVTLAIVVGASLAVAGVVMQGIFRNPLAEPATVGVSGGAAVGAVIAITLGLSKITLGVQIFAFIGGTLATAIVYGLSRVDGKTDIVTLILTGIAINALSGALIGLAVFVADDDQIRTVTFWSLGSLGLATWRAVAMVLPLAIIGVALSTKFSRTLDLMSLGDRPAEHVGVPVERVRLQTIAIIGLLASSAVAATGIIAFVGLIVPHILRLVLGPKHRDLLWSSALLGAIVTLLADLAARTLLSPAELPLGVLTALIGAPFFLWLLRKMRTGESTWS